MKIKNLYFCEEIEYHSDIKIPPYSALEYVKDHVNIFSKKTTRRVHNYGNFTIVSEHSYYDDNLKSWWLWIFHQKKGLFIVQNPNKKLKDVVNIMIESDFDINKIENKAKE